jgi:hypothetical protein
MSLQMKVFIGAIIYVGIYAIVLYKATRRPPRKSEREILKHCRAGLWAIRQELETLPATRTVHELHDECNRTENTINRVEAEVCR